jgi:hypothetical protein
VPNQPQQQLKSTPALERLLERLGRRLARLVWMHGVGTLFAVTGVWLAFAFFADWVLHVPLGVRWVHLAVALALPTFFAWRELARHLKRRPDRAGLAVLIERANPDLHQLLVSAVELQEKPEGDPGLIAGVMRDADQRAAHLSLGDVLEHRSPRRRFAFGSAIAVTLAFAALLEPTYASIFVQRLVGRDISWPQLTWLTVSVPNLSDRARITLTDDEIEVRVARGADVPVLVRADGRVPDDVTIHFDAGHEVVLGTSGGGIFRTLLRSCQEDLAFHVTGGDDRDGEPNVRVIVLEPPDVAGLAVNIVPPAYSGLSERTEYDHDVEVLAGTRLRISMLSDPPEVSGRVRILPENRVVELVPTPFPSQDSAGAERAGLGFELNVTSSVRYRFELEDDSGLSNPDPGLFAVHVVPDRNPEVEIVSPSRLEIDTVPGGTVAIRARVDDDFGINAMVWTALPLSSADPAPRVAMLDFSPVAGGSATEGQSVVAGARVEVAELGESLDLPPPLTAPDTTGPTPSGEGGEQPAQVATEQPNLVGEQFVVDVRAIDNRPGAAPADDTADTNWVLDRKRAGVGTSSSVRVRVVSEEEYLRRLQDRLSRLRTQVTELEDLQRQKSQRTRELLASLESDNPELGSSSAELSAALTGQRRVTGDAEAIARELASIVESLLYSRLDEKATAMLEELDRRQAGRTARSFDADSWRELAASWSDSQAANGLAGQLVRILDLSLTISLADTPAATDALDAATRAVDLAGIHENLIEADRQQETARAHMEQLLGLLAEWDNFQSILSLTRDILNRQKSLRDRTREFAREK